MANGTYWKGTDGNVWVYGDQGVNNAGKWDDNTAKYWTDQGFSRRYEDWEIGNDLPWDPGSINLPGDYGTGSGGNTSQYQSQIDQINALLGTYDAKKAQGLTNIISGYNRNRDDLKLSESRTYRDYDKSKLDNDKARQSGVEDVDQFVNTSYGNLQRVLQRGNAGNSSVGKYLVPQLVSQAGGKRRQGVFDTAGENEANIFQARKDAEQDYGRAFSRLAEEKKSQEGEFLTSINQQKADLLAQRLAYEQEAGLNTGATRADLDARLAELSSLFGKYTSKYTPQSVTANKVNLGKYQVDPAQIRLDQSMPSETRYYAPQLRKREELR